MRCKKSLRFIIAVLAGIVSACSSGSKPEITELWYNKPASVWEEALPIGNGRLGAMVYGIPEAEHIQFNEETLWDCAPRQYYRENAYKYLDKIWQLLFEGKQTEAEALAGKKFMGRKAYEDEFPLKKKIWVDSLLKLKKLKTAIKPDFNDMDWPTMFIDYKSVWERKGLPDMNGGVLFRKTVDIPENWKGQNLRINLGHVKDQDFTWINGVLIGTTDEYNTTRTYTIPGHLVHPGKNVITVLINNYVSTGGFNGVRTGPKKMYLLPTSQKDDYLFIEGDWKYQVIDTKPPFFPQYEADYQPFGDVMITFPGHENYTDFRRNLDLDNALSNVSYKVNGVTYSREYLASHPDEVIAMKLTADKSGMISFNATFNSPHEIHSVYKVDDQTLGLSLKVEDGEMTGTAYLRVSTSGGQAILSDSGIVVKNADEAVLKLVAATNYKTYNDISGDPVASCNTYLTSVADKDYETIKTSHLKDYKPLFDRFSIDLGEKEKRKIPTDERINNVKTEPDDDLAATYVQYARYLMLSSGRDGTNPPNLQGIWNDKMYPAWGSKYTTNINCEMNFWPVEPLNIAECHNSLFKLIDEVAIKGSKTAEHHYGARGWVLHHNTDQWRGTAPINNPNHGIWVTGGAWLCHHLWEHYRYSQDTVFLRKEAWPLIKSASQFFVDFLIKDPKSGYLISTPSNSPEHGGLVAGPTMDHEIIRSLFKIAIQCTDILNTDHEFARSLQDKLPRIYPYKIGRYGQLQEWMTDIDDTTDHHRHVSHLWGVYPGKEFTMDDTPELMDAAKQSLIYRGDDGTGWSLAWKISFWARFLDGEHAYKMIQMLLSSATDPERESSGGSYPNLFDAHPPFQIDGNFGGAAGMVEMLMQSHQGYIQLLPALPEEWTHGEIKGLRARDGFEINFSWKDGRLEHVEVTSNAGLPLRLRYGNKLIEQNTEKGKVYRFDEW
ncbi:glycoside hydrolase N-terminal domain-containing protein [Saccharicrinis sp. FJH62]|uniref:glycoside hydrolase family 95 protein n=1 Tax=Saccharicrinis sp. FJH62 TaxID=3344657 RepID=UPI0035D4B0F5